MSGKVVIISKPNYSANEAHCINTLFEAGLDFYYLRMPDIDPSQLLELKAQIEPSFFNRVIFHYTNQKVNPNWVHLHESLREKTDLKEIYQNYPKNIKLSTSIHNANTLYQLDNIFEFIFLSPVQKSISRKEDNFALPQNWESIQNNPQHSVYALGGINYENAQHYLQQGFKGIGLLGYIWENGNFRSNFLRLRDRLKI